MATIHLEMKKVRYRSVKCFVEGHSHSVKQGFKLPSETIQWSPFSLREALTRSREICLKFPGLTGHIKDTGYYPKHIRHQLKGFKPKSGPIQFVLERLPWPFCEQWFGRRLENSRMSHSLLNQTTRNIKDDTTFWREQLHGWRYHGLR